VRHANQLAALAALAAVAACDSGIETTSGVASRMRVTNGVYLSRDFPVPMVETDAGSAPAADPDADAGADGGVSGPPQVDGISSPNNTVPVGIGTKGLTAFVSPNARTVAIGLEGEPGFWRVPVGQPSLENAPDLEVTAALSFDRSLGAGTANIWLAAADADGHYGPARSLALALVDSIPSTPLAVSLSWSADMDLDLVIKQPDGSLLTPKSLTDASGKRIASGEDVPSIDLDSNIGCLIDGRRRENATWTAPQPGTYEVYVRLAAPCGFPYAGWKVQVLRDGEENGNATGTSYAWEADVKNGGPEGPGRFAVRFTVSE